MEDPNIKIIKIENKVEALEDRYADLLRDLKEELKDIKETTRQTQQLAAEQVYQKDTIQRIFSRLERAEELNREFTSLRDKWEGVKGFMAFLHIIFGGALTALLIKVFL